MYLKKLTREEKEIFLGLTYSIAAADNDFSSSEKELIAEYCREMQLETTIEVKKESFEDLINKINKISNDESKRIITFECIGLAMIDNNYDIKEREIINKMLSIFGLESNFANECEKIIQEYIIFQTKIDELIMG